MNKTLKIILIVVAVLVVIVAVWLTATYFLLGNDAASLNNATNTVRNSYYQFSKRT